MKSKRMFRYPPHNLTPEEIAKGMRCELGNPEIVTQNKCLLYRRSGSPTCTECRKLIRIAWGYFDSTKHSTFHRLPILRPFRLKQVQKQNPIEIKERTGKGGKAPKEKIMPTPPKKYKFLYVGKCGECKKKKKRIVAWDMCWECHWKWKNIR